MVRCGCSPISRTALSLLMFFGLVWHLQAVRTELAHQSASDFSGWFQPPTFEAGSIVFRCPDAWRSWVKREHTEPKWKRATEVRETGTGNERGPDRNELISMLNDDLCHFKYGVWKAALLPCLSSLPFYLKFRFWTLFGRAESIGNFPLKPSIGKQMEPPAFAAWMHCRNACTQNLHSITRLRLNSLEFVCYELYRRAFC